MNETLLARVRALLAKAESTQFEAEAEAFNAKAVELIAKHGIDEALLAHAGNSTDTIGHVRIDITDPYTLEKATLLTAVATSMRCKTLCHRSGRKCTHCTLVGYGTDIARVNLIYTSLLLQATTQVTRQKPTGRAYSTVTFRKSWFAGFNQAVYTRLREAERKAATDSRDVTGSPTALVLRDRLKLVNQEFAELFPSTVSHNTRGADWSEGYGNGRAAGQRADLGGTRLGNHRAALAAR